MDAIKKKMQAMKLEKDNALDRALLCEQQARDANLRAEKAEEEARQLQKKIQAIENDLDQTQESLMQVNAKLEEKEKALQNQCEGGNGNGKHGGSRKRSKQKERHSRNRKRDRAAENGHGKRAREETQQHALAAINCGRQTAEATAPASSSAQPLTAGEAKRAKTRVRPRAATERTNSVSVTAQKASKKKQDVVRSSATDDDDEEDDPVQLSTVANGEGGGGGVGASIMCENNSGPGPGTGGRKRGHQHHPRFGGTRQSTVPAEDVIAALRGAFDGGSNSLSSSSLSSSASSLIVVPVFSATGGTAGNNNNNPSDDATDATIAKQSDDNEVELDDYEATAEAAAAAASADIVNSNIENNNITAIGRQWSSPSKENTPEPEHDLVNNNRSSNRSSVSPKNVIVLNDEHEDSIELKLDKITSGKELVQQISKKLKRSKRSPPSDDTTPASGKKKSSSSSTSSGKKSSSKGSSSSTATGADGGKRKKTRTSAAAVAAAAAAAAALEKRASGDGAPSDLDDVIGLMGAEYGSGGVPAGDYKELGDENDPDAAEWAKLRCTSERTEVIAEREHRRQKRCADYPGLAFGRSIFSSDTMMKFNIIRNELHNIMKTQLKRNPNNAFDLTSTVCVRATPVISESGTTLFSPLALIQSLAWNLWRQHL
uniref:Tropomyosin n=1 Tax=Anopheles atroparvus TaxID=41427 RepID=A0A182JJC0_ANOAO